MKQVPRAITVASLVLLLFFASTNSEAQALFSETSWALGIVVPEGAGLSGGNTLHWSRVQNVTALVILPNISQTDMIIYSVMSLMTEGGYILQVAAGIYPNSSKWLVYSQLFTNVVSNPPKYEWVLNASLPEMDPNALVSISIFRTSNLWSFSVVDLNTGASVQHPFPRGNQSALKTGDQEVFAFESYSRSPSTFENMGNLTLKKLLIDDESLGNNFYQYSGAWEPSHNPLFVVGSGGTVSPTFITLQNTTSGLVEWTYTSSWSNSQIFHPNHYVMILLTLAVIVPVSMLGFFLMRPPKHRRN